MCGNAHDTHAIKNNKNTGLAEGILSWVTDLINFHLYPEIGYCLTKEITLDKYD